MHRRALRRRFEQWYTDSLGILITEQGVLLLL